MTFFIRSSRRIGRRAIAAFVSVAALAACAAAPTPLIPDASAPIEPIKGSLVIVGGGGTGGAIWQRFRMLAGGDTARIVIIPTATANVDTVTPEGETRFYMDTLHLTDVVLRHTRSRDVANSDAFVAPIRRATGVWFPGGDQSRITDAYLGTKTEQELHALLARGGAIGGTSAGAAIMTKVMITGQRVVDGDTVANIGEGFGFLPGAVADQHFIRRNRQGRLIGVLEKHPGLVGFGVDERTALVVHNGRRLEVLGTSEVRVIFPANGSHPLTVRTLTAQSPELPGGAGPSGGTRPKYQADLIELTREAQARTRRSSPP